LEGILYFQINNQIPECGCKERNVPKRLFFEAGSKNSLALTVTELIQASFRIIEELSAHRCCEFKQLYVGSIYLSERSTKRLDSFGAIPSADDPTLVQAKAITP